LEERDHNDSTPLGIAINWNRRDCAERLLDAGAKLSNIHKDVKIPNWFPLFLAQRKRVKEISKILFVLSRSLVGKDVAKMIIAMVWETRHFSEWGN
jgi:hypothetical protein